MVQRCFSTDLVLCAACMYLLPSATAEREGLIHLRLNLLSPFIFIVIPCGVSAHRGLLHVSFLEDAALGVLNKKACGILLSSPSDEITVLR